MTLSRIQLPPNQTYNIAVGSLALEKNTFSNFSYTGQNSITSVVGVIPSLQCQLFINSIIPSLVLKKNPVMSETPAGWLLHRFELSIFSVSEKKVKFTFYTNDDRVLNMEYLFTTWEKESWKGSRHNVIQLDKK